MKRVMVKELCLNLPYDLYSFEVYENTIVACNEIRGIVQTIAKYDTEEEAIEKFKLYFLRNDGNNIII